MTELQQLKTELNRKTEQLEARFADMSDTDSGYYAALLDVLELIDEIEQT